MLGKDQAPLSRQCNLRIIGKDPRSGNNHISLKPQDGLIHLVPRLERDAGLVLITGGPSGQKVFIINEKATIFENRSGKGFRQRGGQGDLTTMLG